MDAISVAARVIFGLFFLFSGMGHFTATGQMTEYTASKGMPAARLGVLVSGLMLVLGGLSIILGLWVWLGALLLIAFLVVVTPVMHNFWTLEDEQARQGDMVNFLKNFALVGALLMFVYLDAEIEDVGPWSIT